MRPRNNHGNHTNSCLTMHQPWASLLVYGIKRIEGRSWPSPIRGRLWIHAAGKVPDDATIKAMEDFYRAIYAVNGVTDIKFPEHYPVSRLLGCIDVVGCVRGEELANWEMVPEGVRLEGLTHFCWLCERPQKLIVPFEMRGYVGVYNLEKKVYEAAFRGLTPVESPLPVKFSLPNPRDLFSLKPGSISVQIPESKSSQVETSSSLTVAIAGARAAATQFSKKDQNFQANVSYHRSNISDSTRRYQPKGKSLEDNKLPSNGLDERNNEGSLLICDDEQKGYSEHQLNGEQKGYSEHQQISRSRRDLDIPTNLNQHPAASSKLFASALRGLSDGNRMFKTYAKRKHRELFASALRGLSDGNRMFKTYAKRKHREKKAPYVAKAEKRKVEYNKNIQTYNKRKCRKGNTSMPPDELEEEEYTRFMKVERRKDFICWERVNKKFVNILDGLELHEGIFSAAEQKEIIDCVFDLQERGNNGQLREHTYSKPPKWMRGKGRETIQFGCCYNYAKDKNGNPPGILLHESVDPLPHLFKRIIWRLVNWHVLPPSCVPDSCIVNIYEEGDCIPPHIDNHDFVRPFCTVSFLSECHIIFGSNIEVVGAGEFSGSCAIALPVGSVLVFNGNGADVAKHCVPAVSTKRISITFRKMDEAKRPHSFVPEPDLQGLQPLSYEVYKSNPITAWR